jgi:2-keto-4-pentenoate hydratase/2-oxohepta-3-ene-1,7-dioic acid hydratase in catechol pathway
VKILRFDDDRVGVLKGADRVVDVSRLISHREERGAQRVMEELIGSFAAYRREIEKIVALETGVALSSVRLLAPIPRPSKFLGAFVNYLDTPERTIDNLPNEFFFKAPELLGSGEPIVLKNIEPVREVQPEAELAFVIGRHAKDVAEADAMDYVFGYVPCFDISARGLKRRSLLIPKGQDTFGPCGPWITTKDEVSDPHNLRIRSWVNNEPRQDYSTRDMAHKIPDQLSWLSRFIQLQVGDIVATGTFHKGLGPINPGDRLSIEIDGLGRAEFPIAGDSPRKAAWSSGKKEMLPLRPGSSLHHV